MFISKNKNTHIAPDIKDNEVRIDNPDAMPDGDVTIEEVQNSPLEEVYYAVKRTLEKLKEDPENPLSRPLFQTVKIDNGQFNRIVLSRENAEYAVGFPAAFIRFINVRYLVAQQRVNEGRATMRIRFVLNDLNNSDDYVETRGFRVFNQINEAIQNAKNYEPALNERCNLTYFDMPETSSRGLQAYWIDYEIWFRSMNGFQYKTWVDKYIVIPPFTNHSDAPNHDTEGHGDHKKPTFEEVVKYEPSVEIEKPIEPENPEQDKKP